jgi:hypothetical protein
VEESAGFVDVLAPKKVAVTKGTLIASAVESLTWGSSRWCIAFKKSSHKQYRW